MGKHGEEEEYFRYDVFISFRGEDIRHTVLRQLREGLGRRGILSFHDDRDMRIGTVFYYVDPSDIQELRSSFGKHMTAHEKEFGKESQRVQAWRSALSEAANLPGMHITPGI
ncbi:TMV resistance protein N-like [Vigna angularis]|uniref:TMV resistance protein N-like n=1 Tax=Phaseolus angularis TaxID=3914 RepID=UPI0022B57031|nr:TMV resistance protein N-like [Vigna angularis]